MAKTIPLNTHNVLDYVGGALLILAPYIFGFSGVSSARGTFQVLGVFLIAYSLLTRYRYSIFKLIPLGAHMALDCVSAIALILAPWALGYRPALTGFQEALHYILGVGVLVLVAFTRPKTEALGTAQVSEDLRRAA